MAKSLFSPCDGTVVAVKPSSACTSGPGPFLTIKIGRENLYDHGLITGITFALAGNYQFLHTVNNFIYLYAFGDRISTINITGVGFVRTCANASNAQILKIYQLYKANRVSRKTDPLDIIITNPSAPRRPFGDAASQSFKFIGYLTGLNIDLKNADPMGTVGFWNMRFDAVLDDTGSLPPPTRTRNSRPWRPPPTIPLLPALGN